ncbi:unnamed protein product [Dibothriocephalus latus]|uniref:Uncharacterized protein n=1 Tax=Dibothriocephalus latus TaxID=60516 RepID=A0A3P7NZB9_DIBLA|nr:unnamed protein product [Dibothriocephalus latus]
MKNVIVSFFVSQDQDRMIIQEYFFLGSHHTALIGLEVPYFYFAVREAMLNFSFYLAQGEIDAAFKSMKLVRSAAIWQNMAKMCVSTRRLDVGLMCLGKMGNAFGAMMVREIQKREPNITVQTGELALQLGMTEEAERIFIECARWDLVARLHQTLGHWEEAVQIAEKRNRVRLRNTHYAYAQELRKQDRIEDAIAQ